MALADFLEKTAAVLDALADDVAREEAAKLASAEIEKQAALRAMEAKLVEATGEALDTETRAKLAAADKDTLDAVQRIISRSSETRPAQSWGGPSAKTASTAAPRSKAEATRSAWDRFGQFLSS